MLASGINLEQNITLKQLNILIAPYKRKENPTLPQQKAELLEYYLSIRDHPLQSFQTPNADTDDLLETNGVANVNNVNGSVSDCDENELATTMLSLSEYSGENVEPVSI